MMNYFELFGLPVSLSVDAALLRKKYLELSRAYHPDYFAGKPEDKQQEALQRTAQLNQGLKILSNPDETLAYVLRLKGLLEPDEKYSLSPDFLMDMMEWNERLAEVKMNEDEQAKNVLADELKNFETQLYAPVESIIYNYTEDSTPKEALLQVKDYYFRKKYLQRLQQQLY